MQFHLVEPLSSEIATENVKNVVGEDVHTSTSSKTVLNNSTVCLSADLLTRLFQVSSSVTDENYLWKFLSV